MKRAHEPWKPCPWEISDAGALQALERGDASADAQKRALDWIIRSAAGTYEPSYLGKTDDAIFAEGRRFVGLSIVKMLRINLSAMRRKDA